MKYRIKLSYLYTDILEVEADSEEEAIDKAHEEAEEEFECYHDIKVEELTPTSTKR